MRERHRSPWQSENVASDLQTPDRRTGVDTPLPSPCKLPGTPGSPPGLQLCQAKPGASPSPWIGISLPLRSAGIRPGNGLAQAPLAAFDFHWIPSPLPAQVRGKRVVKAGESEPGISPPPPKKNHKRGSEPEGSTCGWAASVRASPGGIQRAALVPGFQGHFNPVCWLLEQSHGRGCWGGTAGPERPCQERGRRSRGKRERRGRACPPLSPRLGRPPSVSPGVPVPPPGTACPGDPTPDGTRDTGFGWAPLQEPHATGRARPCSPRGCGPRWAVRGRESSAAAQHRATAGAAASSGRGSPRGRSPASARARSSPHRQNRRLPGRTAAGLPPFRRGSPAQRWFPPSMFPRCPQGAMPPCAGRGLPGGNGDAPRGSRPPPGAPAAARTPPPGALPPAAPRPYLRGRPALLAAVMPRAPDLLAAPRRPPIGRPPPRHTPAAQPYWSLPLSTTPLPPPHSAHRRAEPSGNPPLKGTVPAPVGTHRHPFPPQPREQGSPAGASASLY